MIITPPCIITARLLPGVPIGDAAISIEYSDRPGDQGRTRYMYHIDRPNYTHSNDDLQSGSGGGTLQSGLSSLMSFLAAFAETYRYPNSENADLFPAELHEWAYLNDDKFSLIQEALQTKTLIEE